MIRSLSLLAAFLFAASCFADHPTGLIIPKDLAAQAQLQNRKAAPIVQAVRAGAKTPTLNPAAIPTAPAWDWTPTAGTPVKNQGGCGSCWAFGTCAVYNEALAAQTGSKNGDAAEQDVLNNSGKGSCGGGYWAFDMLVKTGVGSNVDFPYVGTDGRKSPTKRPFKALTWGYVEANGGTPTDAAMKAALCQWGPIGVCCNADSALQNYVAGTVWRSPGRSTNHIVTIVGWDDSKKAWKVKNSWGADFGDSGYFWCAMGSNIGDGAAYVVAKPNWVDEVDVPGLQALGDAVASRDEILIDGPDQAGHGVLVMLEAPPLAGARYTWSHVPGLVADANAKIDTDRRILYFATPCGEDAEFQFCLTVSLPDADPVVVWHTLVVGDSPVPPVPPVPPIPPVPPTTLDAFGISCRDWATSLVPADMRASTAQGIADNFSAVSADIDSGKILTMATAMAAVRAANSKDLNTAQRLAWAPWFDQLTARWAKALDDGELADAPSMSLAGRQAAAGLRAAIPPKLQVEPQIPAPVPVPVPTVPSKPAPAALPKAAVVAPHGHGHWEATGWRGRGTVWVETCPSGTCPSGR
jgi:hypothetical protein